MDPLCVTRLKCICTWIKKLTPFNVFWILSLTWLKKSSCANFIFVALYFAVLFVMQYALMSFLSIETIFDHITDILYKIRSVIVITSLDTKVERGIILSSFDINEVRIILNFIN